MVGLENDTSDSESEMSVVEPEGQDAPRRKQYVRPAVVYEQQLEAVAANCSVTSGKAPGTCTFGFS